jgi:hypothetical protein
MKKIYGPKAFLLTKIKPEFSDILYNPIIEFGLFNGCLYTCISTFNNISVISWWPVLLVEETGVPRENH